MNGTLCIESNANTMYFNIITRYKWLSMIFDEVCFHCDDTEVTTSPGIQDLQQADSIFRPKREEACFQI